MPDCILRVENIKKRFGGVEALKGVGLEIGPGEIHCLAGENGCGKSTLIKIISGFYEADEGSIELSGRSFVRLNPSEAIALGIQVIYQDFSIFPNLTVMENLAINMELMDRRKLVNYTRMRKIAQEAVAKIGFDIDLDERVESLSIASKQLIAVCRALLYDAKLIIMDEPTTALTKKEVKALFGVIKNLQAQGISTLFVSHKLDEVFEISERFTILRNGENVVTGSTDELDGKKFAYYMTGRAFNEESYAPIHVSPEPVLSIEALYLRNGYSDVSLDLRSGEIMGITGLLGSGRTELVQSIFGVYRPDSGTIKLNGKVVKPGSVKAAVALGIGYVPADRLTEGLFLAQSIGRNATVSSLGKLAGFGGFLDKRRIDDQVARWIAEFAIATKDAEQPVQTLSGGNQQKVVLARWLANDLKVLILNGPTVGVDIGSKYDIHALLRKLAGEGLAVIVISDDLPEILACCNRVVVMRDGSIVKELQANATNEAQLSEIVTGVA
ncbi:MAG: sugar ABC transporter ATP-binding protein [Clostridia bacterium]|jgi:simple sugar transport system ATP-binding protein|nr:sugar ABC transporter ATP-binding protein [Spirochaetia bacterium]